MIVWTEGYSPFILGGECHHPVGVEVEPGEKHDIGGGYYGYVITNPINGDTFVAESTTGAFVGPDLPAVRDDIQSCIDQGCPEVMEQQVADAAERRKKVRVEKSDRFWARFKKRKQESNA
jgi:hypothetical protein